MRGPLFGDDWDRMGIMPVSTDLLVGLLALPEGTEIVHAEMAPGGDQVRFCLRGATLPVRECNEHPRTVTGRWEDGDPPRFLRWVYHV